jgi:hypothetical protein
MTDPSSRLRRWRHQRGRTGVRRFKQLVAQERHATGVNSSLPRKRPVVLAMRLDARLVQANVAAPVLRLPTAMEVGNRERAALYGSRRWRRERARFLAAYPFCGCGQRAVIADHRDGHQREDWRERFWDMSTWQPLCEACHAAKSARERAAWHEAGEGIPPVGGLKRRPGSGE